MTKDRGTQWKGDVLRYDELIGEPNNSSEDLYCLTFPQTKALISILELYRYSTRWEGDGVDQRAIELFVFDAQRRLMMGCGCGDTTVVIFRWNSDGELESSSDNGATWEDASSSDPRHTAPQFPPPEDTEDKCIAADNAVTSIIVEVFNNLTADMALVTLDEVLRTWVQTYIGTSNPLLALIAVVRNLVYGLVVTEIIASLTTEVWNKLRCCFRCNILDDLTFDEIQWILLRSCIDNEIGGVAGLFLEHLIYLIGASGATNIARSGLGSPSADCSDCECVEGCGSNASYAATVYDTTYFPAGSTRGEFISRVAGVVRVRAELVSAGRYELTINYGVNGCTIDSMVLQSGVAESATYYYKAVGGSWVFGLFPTGVCLEQILFVWEGASSGDIQFDITGMECV